MKTNKEANNKAIILLSGGLDSVVSLAILRNEYDIKLAITFDYGQKATNKEVISSLKISEYYNIKHEIIKLDWLKDISTSALNTDEEVPFLTKDELNDKRITKESSKSVWVPNRNALFINIAACYAEINDYNYIIIGANKEEAKTFKDNSKKFIKSINTSLENSSQKHIKVIAPLINLRKKEIAALAIKYEIPFNLIYSCYTSQDKQCGKCESCIRLKRALELNNRYDIISDIFE